MNICTAAISDMTNYKYLSDVKFEPILDVKLDDSINMIKYLSGNSDIKLLFFCCLDVRENYFSSNF